MNFFRIKPNFAPHYLHYFLSSPLLSTDDKPVILVFLIHSLKPHSISSLKSWDDSKNIVMHFHIFHHETKSGLLQCEENDIAISNIKEILLKYSEEIKPDQGGIASGKGS